MFVSILADGPDVSETAAAAASVAIAGIPVVAAAVSRARMAGRWRTQTLANRNLSIYVHLNAVFLSVAVIAIVVGVGLLVAGVATGPALLTILGGGGFGAVSLLFSEGFAKAQAFAERSDERERVETMSGVHVRLIQTVIKELEPGPVRNQVLAELARASSRSLRQLSTSPLLVSEVRGDMHVSQLPESDGPLEPSRPAEVSGWTPDRIGGPSISGGVDASQQGGDELSESGTD